MSQLALITPLGDSELPGFGGGRPQRPGAAPPIYIPPAPPGVVTPPIHLPPDGSYPSNPIFIPPTVDNTLPGGGGGGVDNTLPVPPGTIWPPLNPGDGVSGPVLLLVWVVGTDKYRWIKVDAPVMWPPAAQPK